MSDEQASTTDEGTEREAMPRKASDLDAGVAQGPEEPQPAAAAETETATPEEPAPLPLEPTRQWVSLPGSSCNVRIGRGNLENLSHDLKTFVGKPNAAALVAGDNAPTDLVEGVSRQLTDAGFRCGRARIGAGRAVRSVSGATALLDELARLGITADDIVVTIGDVDQLSCAAFVCGVWCDGTQLVSIPLDVEAMTCGTITPLDLDVSASTAMVGGRNATKNVFCDLAVMDASPSEHLLRTYAIMVASAVADTQKAFEALWDRMDTLVAGDDVALRDQLNDTLRSRGRLVSSTSIAVRQSLGYGRGFADALRTLVPETVPYSTLLAEGLRLSARIAVAEQGFSIDDMLAQDEVLEHLGLGTLSCDVDPAAFRDALKAASFRRSRRFLVALPRAFGRVRLSSIEDETLDAHLEAWCAQHRA